MKKILSICMIILILPTIVLATEDPNVVVDSDMLLNYETTEDGIMLLSEDSEELTSEVNGDIYKMEEETNISEKVFGDVYILSEKANITSSQIDGNIFVIADEVNISGNVTGYAYIIANKIEISGIIQGAYIITNEINITENGIIRNDVKVIAENFDLNGTIYRNLQIISENININKNNNDASIFGDVSYNGNLNIEDGLILGGITEFELPEIETEEKEEPIIDITGIITNIVTALLVIILIVNIFSDKCKYKQYTSIQCIKDITVGFGLVILIPILSVLAMITIIGFPIGLLTILVYCLALYIAIPVASIEIANMILKDKEQKSTKIFASIGVFVVLEILRYIPVIGGIIRFLIILFGLRTIIEYIFNKNEQNTDDVIIEQ